MKLVLYSPTFFPQVGGLERVATSWAAALQQMGHTIWVITTTTSPEPDAAAYSILRNAPKAEQVQVMRQADVVLCMNISLKALPLLWRSGQRLIVSHHTLLTDGRFKFQWRQQLKHWICNRFALLNICCSAFVAKPLRRSVVIHSPYNADTFYNQHWPRTKGSVLFVGRLVSDKGVKILLEAWKKVNKDYGGPLQLTICGHGPDADSIKEFVAVEQWEDQVFITGNASQEKVAGWMNTHQVLVVPSVVEPFGTVVPEGLACGCHVVCSRTGGLPEAAGEWAALVPPNDAAALAEQIVEKLHQPPAETTPQLSAHLQKLSTDYSVQQLMAAIQSIRNL